MNRSVRCFLFLLALAVTAANMRAMEEPAVPVSEPNLRIMKLLDSARRGDIAKQVEIADDYLVGHGVKQNVQLAAEWYEKAADAGDPGAQNQIGYLYQSGLGVPRDLERAAHWYQLSAIGGSITGRVNLAVVYIWGIGVTRNVGLGIDLLKEASKKGNGPAAAYLGDMYLNGIGVAPDINKAVSCFERGVKLHAYYAEYKLGVLLSKPDHHPKNLARSIALLKSSAAQGYVPAMYAFGLIAVNYPESNIPHEDALAVLRSASEAGSWKASAVLGVLSRDGKWVPKSPEGAYSLFKRAAAQGGDTVSSYVSNDLHALSAQLDEFVLAKLNQEAMEWASSHPVSLELIHKGNSKISPSGEYALTSPTPGEHSGDIVPSMTN